ncbi:MAG: hypothetical protein ABEJ96_07785, partial [Thiohalorhabdaceae bacterium]
LRLSHALADAIHGDRATSVATTWGLLLKSDYDARVGYHDGRLFLLYRPREQLYDLPYFEFDGKRYYVFRPDGQVARLMSYEADYQGADQRLPIALDRAPEPGGSTRTRSLRFRYQGENYEIEVPLSQPLVEYLGTVPQMDVVSYFRSRPRPQVEEALVAQLKDATEGLPRSERVNLLLRFVQTAFDYQTDQKQFGEEDYMFPEETLFHPASDCEDRSVLFALLVRKVLGLEVAALDYPGHVATA